MLDRFKVIIVLVSILALVASGVVLKAAKGVILPFVIALLLSYMFGPLVRYTEKKKIPNFVAILLVLAIFTGFCYLGVIFINTRITAFAQASPRYYDQLIQLAKSFTSSVPLPPDFWSDINWGERLGRYLLSLSGSLVSLLSNVVLVLIFLFFLLSGAPYFKYKIRKAFSEDNARTIGTITESISIEISRYLTMQFFISLVTGVLVWLALTVTKVDFAITWGVFAFILNFIPTIGSILATIPPILLALVQFYPDFGPAVLATILLFSIQQIMGNIISPKIMGDELNLSPTVILLSLLFWGWLWGVVGALLSVPIVSAMKIVCENVSSLHVVSVMMGSGKSYRKEFEK